MIDDKEAICIATLKDMPIAGQKKVFQEIADTKTAEERAELASAVSPMGPPFNKDSR